MAARQMYANYTFGHSESLNFSRTHQSNLSPNFYRVGVKTCDFWTLVRHRRHGRGSVFCNQNIIFLFTSFYLFFCLIHVID